MFLLLALLCLPCSSLQRLAPGANADGLHPSAQAFSAISTGFHTPTVTFNVSRDVTILDWTGFIPKHKWTKLHTPQCKCQCAVPGQKGHGACMAAQDPDIDISHADAVIFNVFPWINSTEMVLPRTKPAGQVWIAYCDEPTVFDGSKPMCNKILKNAEFMQRIDWVATYSNSSEFPNVFTPPPAQVLRRPHRDFGHSGPGSALATYSSSDCRSESREGWVRTMMQAIKAEGFRVDSYGKCLKTTEEIPCTGKESISLPGTYGEDGIYDSYFATYVNRCMSRPFALVAENSPNVSWYVTEKVWHALATGSIPVYFGPREVLHLVPPGSIIFAGDKSPREIVKLMLEADQESYHRWRSLPTSQWQGYEWARRSSRFFIVPRMCERLSAGAVLMPYSSDVDHLETRLWATGR